MADEDWLTLKQATEVCKVKQYVLEGLIHNHYLSARKDERRWLVHRPVVEALAAFYAEHPPTPGVRNGALIREMLDNLRERPAR